MHKDETLAEEFARLTNEYHTGDEHTKPEAWNLLADFAVDNASAISAALSALVEDQPVAVKALVRHKKRGSEYEVIGIGKMQAEDWGFVGDPSCKSVDMEEVIAYRSMDDGSLWVRPRGEFEDGRFEPVASPVRSALAPAPAGEDAWRPIETAPKDGTEILLYREDCGVMLGRWVAPCEFLNEDEYTAMDAESWEEPDWFGADFVAGHRITNDGAPTHWRPLPAPPALSRKGSDAQTVGDGSTSSAKDAEHG